MFIHLMGKPRRRRHDGKGQIAPMWRVTEMLEKISERGLLSWLENLHYCSIMQDSGWTFQEKKKEYLIIAEH